MISEDINAKYALLPSASGTSMSCESACIGYVLGKSGNEEKEDAAVQFIKYILSEKVQTRILQETEQIPVNPQITLSDFAEEKSRLYQAADLVLSAEKKIDVPDNMWNVTQKTKFTENILKLLSGELSIENFKE